MRSLRSTLVALGVLVGVLVGCGFPEQDSSVPVGIDEPTGLEITVPGDPSIVETITTWFVSETVLVPLSRRVPAPADATTAVAAVTAGVSASEASRGLRSAIPDPTMVTGADLIRGTAVVALASEFLDIPSGDQVLALGQLVYTLTDLRGVGRVRFEINGDSVVIPLPSGESTADSVSRDDFAPLIDQL